MNRRLISQLTTAHFAPTETAADNLRREAVRDDRIFMVGNTVIDALQWVVRRLSTDSAFRSTLDARFSYINPDRRLILVTGHRRENFDGGLVHVCVALRQLADRGDVEIVYPVHLNPRVQAIVGTALSGHPAIHLVEPLEYVPFVALMRRAYLIITDSGGIQEEAPGLGKPVLVTRETTERPEAISAGTARLVGTSVQGIVSAAETLLDDAPSYARMAQAKNPFGDGTAATQLIGHLIHKQDACHHG
jgi:UDP-N-acetylglucosamine 2-epimerase (non-hydrolysing)